MSIPTKSSQFFETSKPVAWLVTANGGVSLILMTIIFAIVAALWLVLPMRTLS